MACAGLPSSALFDDFGRPARRGTSVCSRDYTDCRSRAQHRRRLSVESTDRWRLVAGRNAPHYAGIPLRTRLVFVLPPRPEPPADRQSRRRRPVGGASPGAPAACGSGWIRPRPKLSGHGFLDEVCRPRHRRRRL